MLVSAWADEGLVLGQHRVDDQFNEIMAIPELPKTLALDGCVVTIDAIGSQKRIAQTIRNPGATLKENQAQQHTAVVETFAVEQTECLKGRARNCHQTVNKNHGRIETSYRWAIDTPEYIQYVDPDGVWPDLCDLVLIEAQRRQGD